MLTRLQLYACDFVRWILYTTLHTTNLKVGCQMHFIACSQVHSWLHSIAHSQPAWLYTPNFARWHTPSLLDLCSQVSSQDSPKYTPRYALKDSFNCTRWHTPSLLDCTLPSKLTRCSQAYSQAHSPIHSQLHSMAHSRSAWYTFPSTLEIRSQVHLWVRSRVHSRACSQGLVQLSSMAHSQPAWLYAPKYTPRHALKDAPNCTWWHTPSQHDCTLRSKLSRGKTLPILLDYMLPCMLLHARSRDLLSCRCYAMEGVWLVAGGGQCLAGGGRSGHIVCGVWRVVGGRWQVAGCVWWPKSWRRSIS